MKPRLYSVVEGGELALWGEKEFDESWLSLRHPYSVNMGGREVHSLWFGDYPHEDGARWDCINGMNE